MAGGRDHAQHTRQAWTIRDSRGGRDGAHEGMYEVVGEVVSGIDYGVFCFVAWGRTALLDSKTVVSGQRFRTQRNGPRK